MAKEPGYRPGVGAFVVLFAVCLLCAGPVPLARAAQDSSVSREDLIQSGVAARSRGNIQLSIDLLSRARDSAGTQAVRTRASVELGTSLLQARRFDDAEKLLTQAYAGSSGVAKARAAVELGNLSVTRGNRERAREYYEEAETLAGANLGALLPASLNRARLLAEPERLAALEKLLGDVAHVAEPGPRTRLYLNLGLQARQLGPQGLEIAYRSFAEAYTLLPRLDRRLALETLDALAQLYEDQKRLPEALRMTQAALERAAAGAPTDDQDILVRLEWRKGRILQVQNQGSTALLAYQKAARHLESIRQDLPIEYEDGRSSYRETLQPVFTGLAGLILANLDARPEKQQAQLREAVQALELTRQSEMQDFLGDRCAVDGVRSDAPSAIPASSALIYPVLLPDRLELLMEAGGMIVHRTVTTVGSAEFASRARELAKVLSQYDSTNYLPGAQQLYDWVLRPFEDEFTKRQIQTIVVAADGALRLIPIAALHDGKQFAIERFAIATVTGMSMTSVLTPVRKRPMALLAGMSEPGPVVDKLTARGSHAIPEAAAAPPPAQRGAPMVRGAPIVRGAPMVRTEGQAPVGSMTVEQHAAWLKEGLSLPGVKGEIQALKAMMPSVSLLDEKFTLAQFAKEVASGDYRILHIASHGVFGGSADSSYIMTYDDLLTMNQLESLLRNNQGESASIDLLTLSACESAEGNDRAPLGISGAAIKAKARGVLGTLWPVGDAAASNIMERFYDGLARQNVSKAQALQRAQKELIGKEALAHPFYWAPFVLIGNWM